VASSAANTAISRSSACAISCRGGDATCQSCPGSNGLTARFNPWWGCTRVSPACAHCYADSAAKRFGNAGLWEADGERRFFGEKHWAEPLKWNRKAEKEGKPKLVFCASMSDVFEQHLDPTTNALMDEERDRLWDLIEQTPWLTWQLLTKRPENVNEMVPWEFEWPRNVWIGTSIESSRYSHRARYIAATGARLKFLSCEPLLGSLFAGAITKPCRECSGRAVYMDDEGAFQPCDQGRHPLSLQGIGWVIGGGESGPHHRPTQLVWAKELLIAAKHRGIPFFWKQWGGARPKSNGKAIEGEEFCEIPTPWQPEFALALPV
jgi:protein gp37